MERESEGTSIENECVHELFVKDEANMFHCAVLYVKVLRRTSAAVDNTANGRYIYNRSIPPWLLPFLLPRFFLAPFLERRVKEAREAEGTLKVCFHYLFVVLRGRRRKDGGGERKKVV